jgi:hypothetical protein
VQNIHSVWFRLGLELQNIPSKRLICKSFFVNGLDEIQKPRDSGAFEFLAGSILEVRDMFSATLRWSVLFWLAAVYG